MINLFDEPIVIGYVCSGPTYRESVYDKLKNYYFDDDNLHYCVITDNKNYFSNLNRKNLLVKELKDFYVDFPYMEKYEYFMESDGIDDYGQKFITTNYKFPISVYRFILHLSIELEIKNVTLLCTDSYLDIYNFNNDIFFSKKNIHFNGGFLHELKHNNGYKDSISPSIFLQKKYGYNSHFSDKIIKLNNHDLFIKKNEIFIIDEAARFYIFKNISDIKIYFTLWNETVEYLCLNNKIDNYNSGFMRMNEWIVAPINDFLGYEFTFNNNILHVNHDPLKERRFFNIKIDK